MQSQQRFYGPSPQVLETSVVVIKPDDTKIDHGQLRTQIYTVKTEKEAKKGKEELRSVLISIVDEEVPFLTETDQMSHDGVRGNEWDVRIATTEDSDGINYWGHLAFGELSFDKAGDVAASFKTKIKTTRRGYKYAPRTVRIQEVHINWTDGRRQIMTQKTTSSEMGE